MSRYAQLGQRDRLLASPELWSCYGCAECTESCPTQADPAAFMAAARRYAVASYDRTHLAYLLATSRVFAVLFVGGLVGLLAAFMYSVHRPVDGSTLAFFEFIPSDFVHNLGVGVMIVMGVAALVGLFEMFRRVLRSRAKPGSKMTSTAPSTPPSTPWPPESLAQTRFRKDCADATTSGDAASTGRCRRFAGLVFAALVHPFRHDVGLPRSPWRDDARLRSRVAGREGDRDAGADLVPGATAGHPRRRSADLRHHSPDRPPPAEERPIERPFDHLGLTFLSLLWVAGLTGFVLELALYLPQAPTWGYPMFLVHVAVAMALVLLVPFGKFAHVFYRPVALLAIRLRG